MYRESCYASAEKYVVKLGGKTLTHRTRRANAFAFSELIEDSYVFNLSTRSVSVNIS